MTHGRLAIVGLLFHATLAQGYSSGNILAYNEHNEIVNLIARIVTSCPKGF